MTDDCKIPLDEEITDAWSDVNVTDELRAATLAAATRAADEQAAEGAEPSGAQPVHRNTGTSLPPKRRRVPIRTFTARLAAASLIILTLSFGGVTLFFGQAAFASVNAQSDVELALNRFGTVVQATAEQGDRQDELNALRLVGKDYEMAMSTLVASGYLGSTQVDVDVAAGAENQREALVQTTTACLNDAGCSGTCNGNRYGQGSGQGMHTMNGMHSGSCASD